MGTPVPPSLQISFSGLSSRWHHTLGLCLFLSPKPVFRKRFEDPFIQKAYMNGRCLLFYLVLNLKELHRESETADIRRTWGVLSLFLGSFHKRGCLYWAPVLTLDLGAVREGGLPPTGRPSWSSGFHVELERPALLGHWHIGYNAVHCSQEIYIPLALRYTQMAKKIILSSLTPWRNKTHNPNSWFLSTWISD